MAETLSLPLLILAVLFFLVAFAYSSVGLGGGSSYTALMAIAGVNYLAIPTVSLILNLIVTSVGSAQFLRQGHGRIRLILPFLATSIPFAYLGGSMQLSESAFRWVLFGSLLVVALRIYGWRSLTIIRLEHPAARLAFSLTSGSILGVVAGLAGIGGGVYLVPLIIMFGLGTEKEAATTGALFVWVNSMSGLAARLQHNPVDLTEFLPLLAAVLVGGIFGSYLGAVRLSPILMQRILGVVILLAVVFLARRLLS